MFLRVFAPNNIARCRGDGAQRLKAAHDGDYVVTNTVTLHRWGGKCDYLHDGFDFMFPLCGQTSALR